MRTVAAKLVGGYESAKLLLEFRHEIYHLLFANVVVVILNLFEFFLGMMVK
ncbi:MAG: hypothetical protein QOD75_404 [Blastocatellia bacterium]|jgi:hypothetical protein|nr:hypothetical protein [Blastocatellia bacterium]